MAPEAEEDNKDSSSEVEEGSSSVDEGSSSVDEGSSSVDVGSSSEYHNADENSRLITVDGIDFRARLNRLERLTVRQLRKYTAANDIYVPTSTRKAALCAVIKTDIETHPESENI